jgi:phosphoribosyl-ATP pyrophosphohydrolase
MIRDRKRMNEICAIYENKKLDDNEHKGDWKDDSIKKLFDKVREEFNEVCVDMFAREYELARYELADLINVSKMLLEKLHDEGY